MPDGTGRQRGEIQSCEVCEDGFKYSKMLKENYGG